MKTPDAKRPNHIKISNSNLMIWNFAWLGIFLGFGALAFGILSASAAETPVNPPAASGPAVELPPMMVEESISSVPWLYVNAGGIEFLSRCSASTTLQLRPARRFSCSSSRRRSQSACSALISFGCASSASAR